MKPLLPLSPHHAFVTLVFRFQDEDYDLDAAGSEGPEKAEFARAMLAKHKAGPTRMADMVMAAENRAIREFERRSGLKRINGYGMAYDKQGNLWVDFGVDTIAQVKKVRSMVDRDGRSYEFPDYIEASGLSLSPLGNDGPVYGTESSIRSDAALDDWLDEYATAPKRKRPTPKRLKSPAKRKANRR